MIERVPWKGILVVIGAVLLVVVAFAAPYDGRGTGGGSGDPSIAADGAAVTTAGPGVTTPPEVQPAVDIPQPTSGSQPTQLVVISIDGGCETADGTVRQFLDVAQQAHARYTFFLSGLCLLPDARKTVYHPPGKEPGQSDIPFADETMVAERIKTFSEMYREGHEIGTHFLGHFCSAGGVDSWSAADWQSEIDQARTLLDTWPQNNPQVFGVDPLPFDSSVFKGDRTPCLLGQRPAMWEAFKAEGFRYDASDPGVLQWPRKVGDGALWEFPLPALKLTGTDKWVLSMDYNFLVNQTNGETEPDAATCARVEEQTYQTYMDALAAVHDGNRAPLILGSHLNDWVCDAYIKAMQRFIADVPTKFPDVQLVSFQDLANWLDAMDPAVLRELQSRPEQKY